ncbi:MAG: peptidylprolyl isomerase [Bacteroidia bacterium]|nr:peptidylprolyl isomerase [Bacteroidia bacterium]
MNYKKLFNALFIIILTFLMITSFKVPFRANSEEIKLMIVTDFGTIKLKLYNETPVHRDNFVKLIKAHYFDSLMFHRVIQNFMIQGGDPDSKNAPPLIELGNGGPGYNLPAEFNSKLFHKKGVLAAARDSDLENPSQASSASQFYIVQGRVYNDSLLNIQAKRITKLKLFNTVVNRDENKLLLKRYQAFVKTQQEDSMKVLNDIITKQVEAELPATKLYTFTDEQIKTYTTIGGTPHLDQSYTVFGEVYEGIEVIDSIAKQTVGKYNRPVSDIRMKISIIE